MTAIVTAKAQRQADNVARQRLEPGLRAAQVRAGVPAAWVAGDEVYGADPDLRAGLREHGLGYVLAIGCNRRVAVNAGRTRLRADAVAARLTSGCWQQMSAGNASQDAAVHTARCNCESGPFVCANIAR